MMIRARKLESIVRKLTSPSYYFDRFTKLAELGHCYLEVVYLKPKAKQLLKENNGDLWLVCERGDEAKDNGYVFFEYVRRNHPHTPIFYLIKKTDNPDDFNRVAKLGNVVEYGSKEHKIYFLAATKLISTLARGFIEPWKYPNTLRVLKESYWEKKFIFLQHGVIPNNLKKILGKDGVSGGFDLFICGAKPEYDEIIKNYGYEKEQVAYTGLARYDNLHELTPKKQILLMPTWRRTHMQSTWGLKTQGKTVDDSIFLGSEYYKKYIALINNERLHAVLKSSGTKLIFYPHYEAQKYIKYFKAEATNKTLTQLADMKHFRVDSLLKESSLLITDYSSVLFDFAYMLKPAVYYQFDEANFFNGHYERGYFSYSKDGFGLATGDLDVVVDEVERIIHNNFKLDKKYQQKAKRFFPLRDRRNSERIYKKIASLNHEITGP